MSHVNRLLPKSSGHSFEGDATRIILSPNEHIAPAVRTCRGSIYRTRNDGRHKCRPYKDLKGKFLYYQVTNLDHPLCKLHLGNSLSRSDPIFIFDDVDANESSQLFDRHSQPYPRSFYYPFRRADHKFCPNEPQSRRSGPWPHAFGAQMW